VYLSAVIAPDQTPEDVLGVYLAGTLNVNRGPDERLAPVFSVFYAHPFPVPPPASPAAWAKRVVPVHPPSVRLTEFGDGAAEEAERVFWATIEALGLRRARGDAPSEVGQQDGRGGQGGQGGQEEGEDGGMVAGFWPPLEPEDTSAVDEW
jgi:hypothetical protein